jgi:hypothetical protein
MYYEEKSCPQHQNNQKIKKYAVFTLVMSTNCQKYEMKKNWQQISHQIFYNVF